MIKTNQLKPILIIIGTRPEGIKMIPVYNALKKRGLPTLLCSTGQHDNLLKDVFDLFNVKPDFELNIMKPNQDLFHITCSILDTIKTILNDTQPSLVLVQGDTTTVMCGTLASYYLKIPVGHIEAGLRTDDIYGPFPEEINRRFISLIASYHFTPTQFATDRLLIEGHKKEKIFCTGNTVVDALYFIQNKINKSEIEICKNLKSIITQAKDQNKKIILLTAHRRESIDSEEIINIFNAIKDILETHKDIIVIYPMHPNPKIKKLLEQVNLQKLNNIIITEPLNYKNLVYVLSEADIVMTDSGGIQEEAISLGKPTLILRNKTDRQEGILLGLAKLVGLNKEKIKQELDQVLKNYNKNKNIDSNLYGNGYAADKIANIIKEKIIF